MELIQVAVTLALLLIILHQSSKIQTMRFELDRHADVKKLEAEIKALEEKIESRKS